MGYCKLDPGIYIITNIIDNKIYIGASCSVQERLNYHYNNLKENVHINIHLQRAYNKYGVENFTFEVLEKCLEEFIYSQENYWCNLLNTHNDKYGYNIKPTNPYGESRHSEETRKKMSEKHKGKKLTEEHKNKISNAHKGKIRSKESIEKGASKLRNVKKRPVSDETLKRMSEASKKRNFSEKARKASLKIHMKPISIMDLNNNIIETFESIKSCSIEYNIYQDRIREVLTNKREHFKGYKFKLLNG